MSKHKNTADTSLHVRNYPSSLCREHESVYGDETFMTVSFRFEDRWGSFIVNPDDLEASVRRDGEEIPGRLNINLVDPSDVRMVLLTADDGIGFVNQAMFNSTIIRHIGAFIKSNLPYRHEQNRS